MPRRRKSGLQPELFSIRWHSIADPTTPSVDIMSSPDPLNEATVSISSIAPPSSSRRMTRSQRSQRFISLDDSPRKRKFQLEVGDKTSPQRLLVTVETEDDDATMTSGTRRKLFQSPASVRAMRRMEHTTTTTVPLRDSIEDIEDELSYPTTPRRRGRPRKSNGTPIPTAGVKRRAGTPIQRSPRRQRITKSGDEEAGEALPEASIHATPTSAKRGRPPKNRTVEPSSELGTAKRDGRRRKAMAPDELIQITEEAAVERSSIYQAAQMSENGMDLIRAPSEYSVDEAAADIIAAVASNADAESDIWMTTMSHQATPRAATQSANTSLARPSSRVPRESAPPEPEADIYQGDDYGYLAPAASDSSSAGGPPDEPGPQNNDTIAQGEDFSMIFMDSIPSLQASLHGNSTFMHAAHDDEELGEETNLIINNTLETLRQEVADDETINITEPVEVSQPPMAQEPLTEEAPTPVRPEADASPRPSPSPWWSRKPKKTGSSPLRRQVLKSSVKQAENSMMHDMERGQGGLSSRQGSRGTISASVRDEDSNMYEDSFSEIPQDYLAAATPRRPDLIHTHDDQDDEMEDVQEEEQEEQLEIEQSHETQEDMEEQPALSHASATAQSTVRRLPTPDKTPPQLEIEEDENQEEPAQNILESPRAESPTPPERDHDDMDEDIQHQISESLEQPGVPAERSVKATPVNQMSSPLQEPQSLAQESPQEKSARPVLSSIVRAGRVLQSVTSDPPSPGDREKQLGSPFRSSGSKESLQASKDIHNNRLLSKSPPQPLNFARRQATTTSQTQTNGGRAGSAGSNLDMNGSRKALDKRNKETAEKNRPPSRESAASSMRITPPSDGVMSWVENEGPLSPRLRGDNTLLEVSRLSGARAVKEPIPLGQIDGAGDETDEESQAGDDEMDIWEMEAERETPKPARQQSFGSKAAPMYRSTVGSPWAKKSPRRPGNAVAESSNKQTKSIGAVAAQSAKATEVDEYSMLSQKQPAKGAESASKSNRFDLSTFFSSPAAIPGMLAEKFLPAKTKSIVESMSNQVKPAEPVQASVTVMPTNSMFPRQAPQKEVESHNGPRTGLFSPVRSKEPEKRQPVERSSSPATPEKIQVPVVAQKQNFTPRPRQTSHTFPQPSSSRAADTVTPPRMQLSHADIHRWQQETSNASEESPNLRSLLRPLPAKNASPKKSSLRSPLKPRTPGRVVEFTSSVLSPQEQAIIREQRRRANSALSHEPIAPIAPPEPAELEINTENNNAPDVAMSDALPATTNEPPEPEPLSQTVWTRQHWLFLDNLLQLRRQKPFEQDYDRCAEEYLGLTVKSQGEAMVLERWHLDCIDAFKAEVGSWDEGVLAKRLFALILGEERRRRGMAEQAPRVMFH